MDEEKSLSFSKDEPDSEGEIGGEASGTAFENNEAEGGEDVSLSESPSLDLLLYDSDAHIQSTDEVDSEDYIDMLASLKETIARARKESKPDKSEDKEEALAAEDSLGEIGEENIAEKTAEEAENDSAAVAEGSTDECETEEVFPAEAEELSEALTEDGEQLELDLGALALGDSEDTEDKTDEESSEEEEKKDSKRKLRLNSIFEIAELFVFTLAAVMLLTNFVFRHSEVDGDSMMNTLHDGDHLIISDLFYKPDYGDIIVFTSADDDGKALVKRVVALEGDVVDFSFDDGNYTLYINGEKQNEAYAYTDGLGNDFPEIKDYVVKEGEVFVLGDHRNNSKDSRYFGAIDIDSILGRVIVRFYPFEDFGTVD